MFEFPIKRWPRGILKAANICREAFYSFTSKNLREYSGDEQSPDIVYRLLV